ncbi:MAG: acetyl-CoA carboxylase biotin carboxylase subunit [Phycisphaerales bacterium]|nr:acetyl-CoA carboxylase biotin carboxylase subunit [Phycisphaerales bacterium]MCB9856795.1 acetyl-CoA carboxylase biotin carboxylase subunit [Phycisphaerales bacterium]MCB9862078.1 acetyl-CoA carboxylase biotin carboxylase subunit [Phycisphaerales bacterium]
MFSRILIANRGEIALRIIRACKELGIETVAVFSTADRDAPHLRLANKAICIGGPSPGDSYLRADRIIAAAEVCDVDAIHPGYGFLAENADFSEQCRDSKIEFIGPGADAIRLLGDKAKAKALAKKSRVNIVPGSDGIVETDEEAIKISRKIGYPVLIKASAGGGGKGMRIAHNEASLRTQLRNARNEAMNAFRDDRVYIEKLIEEPRHVEVQILADQHGNCLHLFERDCTLQRRHQKLVEEHPSTGINEKTRDAMCKAAIRLVQAANYFSAGTVEYVVDKNGEYYFLEVNTRIQVEHPVTELITGIDLIKWMIRIAAGEKLTLRQKDIQRNGAAIEVRINAEDPDYDFRPSPGKILTFRPPGGLGVRFDSHISANDSIPPYYDSMIAKLLVHAPDRDEAIRRMRRCLEEFEIGPIKTTIPILQRIFSHTDFVSGNIDTGFIERTFQQKPKA